MIQILIGPRAQKLMYQCTKKYYNTEVPGDLITVKMMK